jgi:hypothetical protein
MQMIRLHPSINVTHYNIFNDVLFHIWPPVQVMQIMINLVASRVNGHLGIVSFIQNLFSKLITFENHQPVLELHHTLLINVETGPCPSAINFLI